MSIYLEYTNNEFFLLCQNKLPNPIKLQIEYYGFKQINDNELNFVNENNSFDLNEFINYLKKNKIDFSSCESIKKLIEKKNNEIKSFLEKVQFLGQLKEKLDDDEFGKFNKQINYLHRPLKIHQKKSLYHLYHAGCAANFSVPGSGKTSVVIAYYEQLKNTNEVEAIFLIGPKNCYYSWQTEFKLNLKRDPKLRILDENKKKRKIIYESLPKNEIFACHYSNVANDLSLIKTFLGKKKFLLVIDEAHNIKKVDGLWSNAILNLKNLSKYKVILTGTPMPQNFRDFYNYLEFLYPNYEVITSIEKAQIEVLMDNKNFVEAANLINYKIHPFYTRVTKKELGLSTPNFINPYLVKMNPIENKIHEAIITKIKYYAENDYLKNIDLIKKIRNARIIRLRQTCSYVRNLITAIPDELASSDENLLNDQDLQSLIAQYDTIEVPAKIEKLKEISNELINQNKKILIWSTHLKTIDLINKELKNDGINIKVITGKTKLDEREKIKDEFNDTHSDLDAIIAIPQACSESISLHKSCHNAIYYDMNYSTAEFLQSLDRIHRVGGSEDSPVYYHFLQYEKSIDIKIYEKIFEKADRQMQVIEKDNLTFTHADNDILDELYNDLNL